MNARAPRLRMLAVIGSSELGGAERVLVSLIKGLDPDRFAVWVVCHRDGPMVEEYRKVAAGVWSFNLVNIFEARTVQALAGLMRRLQCQIVHTHLWTADVLGGVSAARARVPIRVATVHGEYFRVIEEKGVRRVVKVALSRSYRAAYRLFDRVIAVSQSVADDLAGRPGVRVGPPSVRVIPNGVDVTGVGPSSLGVERETLGVSPGTPVVLVIANFVPMKGHPWLIEAVPRVLQRVPNAVFLLAGSGDQLPRIRRAVAEARLEDHVRFLGFRRDALDLIAFSDVVVLPSVSAEGTPIVVLEVLSLGKPLVATRVGGIPEVVEHGRTGLLVPPRDAAALAEAIVTVLSNRGLAGALGAEARDVARARFSAEVMARKTEELFLDMATAKGIHGNLACGS